MPTVKEILYGDAGYTGAEPEASLFSLDYYRNKVREFQDSLNRTAAIADAFSSLPPDALDSASYDAVVDWLNDYYARRGWILDAAEGVNLLAQGANAVGLRFPVVSAPAGLAALPPLVAIAGVAALAAIVAVVEWSAVKQAEARNIAGQIEIAATLPADQRAAALQAVQAVQTVAEQSGISATIANTVKWAVLAFGAYLAAKFIADRY